MSPCIFISYYYILDNKYVIVSYEYHLFIIILVFFLESTSGNRTLCNCLCILAIDNQKQFKCYLRFFLLHKSSKESKSIIFFRINDLLKQEKNTRLSRYTIGYLVQMVYFITFISRMSSILLFNLIFLLPARFLKFLYKHYLYTSFGMFLVGVVENYDSHWQCLHARKGTSIF